MKQPTRKTAGEGAFSIINKFGSQCNRVGVGLSVLEDRSGRFYIRELSVSLIKSQTELEIWGCLRTSLGSPQHPQAFFPPGLPVKMRAHTVASPHALIIHMLSHSMREAPSQKSKRQEGPLPAGLGYI